MCLSADGGNSPDKCSAEGESGKYFGNCEGCEEYIGHCCNRCRIYKPYETFKIGLCKDCRKELKIV